MSGSFIFLIIIFAVFRVIAAGNETKKKKARQQQQQAGMEQAPAAQAARPRPVPDERFPEVVFWPQEPDDRFPDLEATERPTPTGSMAYDSSEGAGSAVSMAYTSSEGQGGGAMPYASAEGAGGGSLTGSTLIPEGPHANPRHSVKPITESAHGHVESSITGVQPACGETPEDVAQGMHDAAYDITDRAGARIAFAFDRDSLVRGLLYGEILGKPKALRR